MRFRKWQCRTFFFHELYPKFLIVQSIRTFLVLFDEFLVAFVWADSTISRTASFEPRPGLCDRFDACWCNETPSLPG